MMEGTFGSIFHANLHLSGLSVKEVVVKTVKSNILDDADQCQFHNLILHFFFSLFR